MSTQNYDSNRVQDQNRIFPKIGRPEPMISPLENSRIFLFAIFQIHPCNANLRCGDLTDAYQRITLTAQVDQRAAAILGAYRGIQRESRTSTLGKQTWARTHFPPVARSRDGLKYAHLGCT